MERRNFLKRLFGAGVGAAALATVPGIAKTRKQDAFKIEDVFEQSEENENLFFLKCGSWLEKEIVGIVGDGFVGEENFITQKPVSNCYIKVKDEYIREDFERFLLTLKANLALRKSDYCHFCDHTEKNGKKYGAMSIFRMVDDGYYMIRMNVARNPNYKLYQ